MYRSVPHDRIIYIAVNYIYTMRTMRAHHMYHAHHALAHHARAPHTPHTTRTAHAHTHARTHAYAHTLHAQAYKYLQYKVMVGDKLSSILRKSNVHPAIILLFSGDFLIRYPTECEMRLR